MRSPMNYQKTILNQNLQLLGPRATINLERQKGAEGATVQSAGQEEPFDLDKWINDFKEGVIPFDEFLDKLDEQNIEYDVVSNINNNPNKYRITVTLGNGGKRVFNITLNQNVETKGTDNTDNTTGASETNSADDSILNTFEELKQYVQSLKSNMTEEPYKTYFDQASATVLNRLNTTNFQSITKTQIEAEIKTECEALKNAAEDDKNNPDQKIQDAAKGLITPLNNVRMFIVANCKEEINNKDNLQIGYNFDSNGNIQFAKGSDAEKVFNKILSDLITWINNNGSADALKDIGGDAMLKKLLQSAWIEASNSVTTNTAQNTRDFINKIMSNLDRILSKVATDSEYLDYYTNDCYNDQTLQEDLPYLYDNDLRYGNARKYDSGKMHLDDDESDKKFQETMNKLLENIYNKYPKINKDTLKKIFYQAQENALKLTDIPINMNIGNDKTTMHNLVNLVLYHFDKLFKANAGDSSAKFAPRAEDPTPRNAISSQTDERNNDIKIGVQGLMQHVNNVRMFIVANCKESISGKSSFHTEFGMDKDGHIVFQENDTQTVYNTILDNLKTWIKSNGGSDALEKLGGDKVLDQLLQASWITAYNDFDSSQSHDVAKFVNQVMYYINEMLNKLQTNPELLEVFTQRSSYADNNVTDGVKHYNTRTTVGNDETISYGGNITTHADGSVHISNTNDDYDYQTTMNALLQKLLNKYPSLDTATITSVFHEAQYKAIEALQGNRNDCPYGTGNNNGRVEDSNKDWSGKDNRRKDHSKIHMDQLVQITLYYFDKLLYAELLK